MNHEIHETLEKGMFFLIFVSFVCSVVKNAFVVKYKKLGLIIDFGHYPKAQIERIIL